MTQPVELSHWEKEAQQTLRMRKNYRGRRFLACRAFSDIHDLIESLDVDDGTELPPPDRALPAPPTAAQKLELQNMAACLLRMICAFNDGGFSPQKLPRY